MRRKTFAFVHARSDSSSTAAKAAWIQRALEAATATTLQRKRRLQHAQREIAGAESAEKKAFAAAATAQEALHRSNRAAATGATANLPTQTRQQGDTSRSERPGHAAFFAGSVLYMVSALKEEFITELGASVVSKASVLLASVRKTPLHQTELISMRKAWPKMDRSTWQGPLRAALSLMKALRMAHDGAQDPVVL